MFIKVLRQTMLAGQVVRVGDVVEASLTDAKLLIGIGKAILSDPILPICSIPSTPKRKPKP